MTQPRSIQPINIGYMEISELKRTLGFLSNFAIAFSFISVSTGSFGNFGVGIGLGGPAFFWSWPIVIVGQLLVALVFAELASHFPVAGSIYQWSKRLSNRTLGWFTGWIYFIIGPVAAAAIDLSFLALLGLLIGRSVAPAADNWPHWRGPHANGTAPKSAATRHGRGLRAGRSRAGAGRGQALGDL